MCGIAGFSLNAKSTINARALSHALLSAIEVRGSHASGYGYATPEGGITVYKDKVAGSNLPLKSMPRNAKQVILHTRYATTGPVTDNTNNHPVWSPRGSIALVHNGVIWNNIGLRFTELEELDKANLMPQVDTACIPALIERDGVAGIQHLAGDAAVAWLNTEDTDILHLARIEGNPIAYTNLADGSFVFASTPQLLRGALDKLNYAYGEVFSIAELDYLKVQGGVIWNYGVVPEPRGYGRGLAASTRNATSGGHTSTYTGATSGGGKTYGIGSSFGPKEDTDTKPIEGGSMFTTSDKGDEVLTDEEALDRLEQKAAEIIKAEAERQTKVHVITSMPFKHPELTDASDDYGDEAWAGIEPRYFTIDVDGNMETYIDLDQLEEALLFLAGRTPDDEGLGEGQMKWVNHFSDIGSFADSGSTMVSWLEDPEELASLDEEGKLGYIKDGAALLVGMAGR